MGIISDMPSKGGVELNNVIEEFKYVYQGQNINSGDFVSYINGVSSVATKETTTVPLDASRFSYATACAIDKNRVLMAYCDNTSSNSYLQVANIDGANIKLNTRVIFSSSKIVFEGALLIDENKVALFWKSSGNSGQYISVVLIEGEIPTFYPSVEIGGTRGLSLYQDSYYLLDKNKVFYAYNKDNRNSAWYSVILTFSGGSISQGTEVNGNNNHFAKYGSNNTAIGCYSNSYALVTINGNTITLGTQDTMGVEGTVSITNLSERVVLISGTNGQQVYDNGTFSTLNTSGSYLYLKNYDENKALGIKSNSNSLIYLSSYDTNTKELTLSTGFYRDKFYWQDYGYSMSVVDTNNYNSGIMFGIGTSGTSSGSPYVASLFGITGNTISTNITTASYEQQVKIAEKTPFDGVALSKGTGGDNTGHNEQVKIARPTP